MEAIEQLTAVLGVLALVAITVWWLRRRGFAAPVLGRGKTDRRLECLARLSLGPHQILHLVRLGETAWLVASGPSGCTLLLLSP